MNLPQSINENLKEEYKDGLFPLVEIELNGTIFFKHLVETIQNKIPYNIVKADIEYSGKANFGKLLIHLKDDIEGNAKVFDFLNQSKIKNSIRGYVA